MIPEFIDLLSLAFAPCPGFTGPCAGEAVWDPSAGHVPRGWATRANNLSAIDLIIVTAEPGDPSDDERRGGMTPDQIRAAVEEFALAAIERDVVRRRGRPAPFHRNLRLILDFFWPDTTLHEQLSHTWLTQAVLCSARVSGGTVKRSVSDECGRRYLAPQLALLPKHAFILALGGKAERRLRQAGYHPNAVAFHPSARGTRLERERNWKDAGHAFRRWRDDRIAEHRSMAPSIRS